MKSIDVKVAWPGREEVHFACELSDNGQIKNSHLTGIGNNQLLALLKKYRTLLKGDILKLPDGSAPSDLCLREVILKAQSKWLMPYTEEELCHCRAVPTAVVDQAICAGAHTTRQVSEQTSASTACGTCRPDVEAMIKYRLAK